MVFAPPKGKAMTPSKHLLRLILCSGIALFFAALASRAMHSDTVTFRFSPADGFEFKAEGAHK
jgi:hypothetical protein